MSIRLATIDDLPAIMDLEQRSFPTDAWSAETMGTELTSAHTHYLVDEVDGQVIGYGGLRALRGESDADIQTIALDPAFRGRGRGRALLRALIDEAIARGAKELFLEVRADNPVAEGLYVAEGFAELGRRPRYYQPDDVDAIVMRLDLRAERPVGAPAGHADQRTLDASAPDASAPDGSTPDVSAPDASAPDEQEQP